MKKKWRPLDAANKFIHHYITIIKSIPRGYAASIVITLLPLSLRGYAAPLSLRRLLQDKQILILIKNMN